MNTADRCPRCCGPLYCFPRDTAARSRTTLDRSIPICAPCGEDEAIREARRLAPIPAADWPIGRPA